MLILSVAGPVQVVSFGMAGPVTALQFEEFYSQTGILVKVAHNASWSE
jgi:hypothetical protein